MGPFSFLPRLEVDRQPRAAARFYGVVDGTILEVVMPDRFQEYCNGCPYNSGSTKDVDLPLSMEHNSDTTALLIFQAPGCHEWKQKLPICRSSSPSAAARIRNSLDRINASRADFSITNAVQCYPGVGSSGRDKPPRIPARRQCANWLKRDIEDYPWGRIVVFGRIAEQSVRCLGYVADRFRFIRHPTGRLSNEALDRALRWALVRNNADD